MRFMLTFQIGLEEGNAAVKDGTLSVKPSNRYSMTSNQRQRTFRIIDGSRGGYLVINMDGASRIPAIAEPLFLGLGAIIKIHPVMMPEDLGRATEALQQVAQKYG